MAEEEREVKPLQIDFKCPNCENGYMRPTGSCLPMNPPLFPHMCNKTGCGYTEAFKKTYPHIDYR